MTPQKYIWKLILQQKQIVIYMDVLLFKGDHQLTLILSFTVLGYSHPLTKSSQTATTGKTHAKTWPLLTIQVRALKLSNTVEIKRKWCAHITGNLSVFCLLSAAMYFSEIIFNSRAEYWR